MTIMNSTDWCNNYSVVSAPNVFIPNNNLKTKKPNLTFDFKRTKYIEHNLNTVVLIFSIII